MEGFFDINNYEKISDDIYSLGFNMILRFYVVLNRYSDKFGKENYHREYEYYSGQSRSIVRNIRRSFDYHLTIENERNTDALQKDYINIRAHHMMKFIRTMEIGMSWFSDERYADMYQIKNSHLILVNHPKPLRLDLDLGRSITFEPIVYSDRLNNECQGVRMYLNQDSNYCDMSLDKYIGLYYIVSKMDMYNIACSMVNYLNRDIGENVLSFDNRGGTEQRPRKPAYIESKNKEANAGGKTGRVPLYIEKQDKDLMGG